MDSSRVASVRNSGRYPGRGTGARRARRGPAAGRRRPVGWASAASMAGAFPLRSRRRRRRPPPPRCCRRRRRQAQPAGHGVRSASQRARSAAFGAVMAARPSRTRPYYQLTRKVAGKTVTTRLTAGEGRPLRRWIATQRELRRLIAEMEQISRQAAGLILSEPPETDEHREISPVNTGTAPRQQPVTHGQRVLSLARRGLPTVLPVSCRQNCAGDLFLSMAPGSDSGVWALSGVSGSAAGMLGVSRAGLGVAELPG